jgi:hypothetical protein
MMNCDILSQIGLGDQIGAKRLGLVEFKHDDLLVRENLGLRRWGMRSECHP